MIYDDEELIGLNRVSINEDGSFSDHLFDEDGDDLWQSEFDDIDDSDFNFDEELSQEELDEINAMLEEDDDFDGDFDDDDNFIL